LTKIFPKLVIEILVLGIQRRAGYAGPVTSMIGVQTAYGVGSPDAEYPTNVDGAPVKIRLDNHVPVSVAKPMNAFFKRRQSCNLIGILPRRTPPQSVLKRVPD
jgi:hypothetical protein